MLPRTFISSLGDKCASVQCPDCGDNHSVNLFVKGLLVSPQFEEETCEGFKDLVNNLVKTEVRRFINDPFPHLR